MTPSQRAVPALALTCLFAASLVFSGASMAQGGPGGGMPGQRPGGPPGQMTDRKEQRTPALEDLLPPDPLRLWHTQLTADRASLALKAEQQPTFDAFLRELDDVQRLNAQRMLRTMRHVPVAVSARLDVERDLHDEAADAKDWAAALDDLAVRWRALSGALSPEQRARIESAYLKTRQMPPRDGPPRP